MKKIILVSLSMLAFSSSALACSNHVNMSMPHVGELELLESMQHTQDEELKTIDIYQIFSGELEKKEPVFNVFTNEPKNG